MDKSWIAKDLRGLAVSIESISPDPNNLRDHGGADDFDMSELRESIVEHGQLKAIVVDSSGVCVAGSGLLLAARHEGKDCIAVVRYDASPEELERFAFRDNRTAELSWWHRKRVRKVMNKAHMKDLHARLRMDELFNRWDEEERLLPPSDPGNETFIKPDKPGGFRPIYRYFGVKRKVAAEVWKRFGTLGVYAEPFFGSGAVYLARPDPSGLEIINDIEAMICNFWRAVKHDPEAVAGYADYPGNETDLHAREVWLVNRREIFRDKFAFADDEPFDPAVLSSVRDLEERLLVDPDYYDAKVAGWWVWGMAYHLGTEFSSGAGSWRVVDGRFVQAGDGPAVTRRRIDMFNDGGVLHKDIVDRGVGDGSSDTRSEQIINYMRRLRDRTRSTIVCSGDWTRSVQRYMEFHKGMIGIFLDPPYAGRVGRHQHLYNKEDYEISDAVREWAIERGSEPRYRVALCGYEDEHDMPENWSVVRWRARCMASKKRGFDNERRECIWFSPNCILVEDGDVPFDEDFGEIDSDEIGDYDGEEEQK